MSIYSIGKQLTKEEAQELNDSNCKMDRQGCIGSWACDNCYVVVSGTCMCLKVFKCPKCNHVHEIEPLILPLSEPIIKSSRQKMKLLKIINTDNGWNNVVCIADSEEAAAFYMEFESVKELYEWKDESGGEIIFQWIDLVTLPKNKYWDKHNE
jgi:hypothetical protein